MRTLVLLMTLLLAACGGHGLKLKKDTAVDPISQIRANLAFTCRHERIPEASADSDLLFKYARWLQKNNQLKEDPAVDAEVERLYRIAAEHQHYKASINLINGAFRGHFKVRGEERLRLSQELMDAGVASGYYFVGLFLQRGSAGLREDPEMALRYYRKAADEGSALAQALVADKLAPIDIAPDIARQMRRCAAEQGNGEAARALGVHLSVASNYQEALTVFQLGAAAGDESSAGRLWKAFEGPPPTDTLYYLNQEKDLERAERYKAIWSILADYSYASPKVPEINEIVPLPPAELPPWDGKLQWLEERKANIPPPKPSEALIHQLARDKHLDPATGRPTPESPHFVYLDSPPICVSGEPCPRAGYWEAMDVNFFWITVKDKARRRFREGEILPTLTLERRMARLWPLPPKVTEGPERVRWRMLGEA
ncbi:SEL1-like repeat protein [Metapseudomonas furukawaii]|uniref:SEL1-like repeat protein n=1 Tax=Metapseudomonas furukawaii TaxID=1149133 RepID=UPI0040461A5D